MILIGETSNDAPSIWGASSTSSSFSSI